MKNATHRQISFWGDRSIMTFINYLIENPIIAFTIILGTIGGFFVVKARLKSIKLLSSSDSIDSIIEKYPGIVKHFGVERNKINVLPELIFKRRVWNALPSELQDTEPLICFPPDIKLNASSFLTTFELPLKSTAFMLARNLEFGCCNKIEVTALLVMLKKLGYEGSPLYQKVAKADKKTKLVKSVGDIDLYGFNEDDPLLLTDYINSNEYDIIEILQVICGAMGVSYDSFLDLSYSAGKTTMVGLGSAGWFALGGLVTLFSHSRARSKEKEFEKAMRYVAFNEIVSYFIENYGSEA